MFLLGLLGSAGVAAIAGIPHPGIQDEFSYLLAADTFAHGRLANPPHPMWIHMDTVHVLQEPTYASKYPPGQGLLLALGEVVAGAPVVAVWLASGLMCAAVTWMLYAWVPSRWALLGGLLAAFQFGIASYWSQSYMPSSLPAVGGALVFGGVRRLASKPATIPAVAVAVGMAILANTRMWEGLLISIVPALLIAASLLSAKGAARRRWAARAILPMGIVLLTTAVAMAIYNRAVTGDAFLLPYVLHSRTHYATPNLFWLPPGKPIATPHAVLAYRAEELNKLYVQCSSVHGYLVASCAKLLSYLRFYIGIPLSIPWQIGVLLAVPLLMLPWIARRRWEWVAVGSCTLAVAGLLCTPWDGLAYLAPATSLIILLVLQCMRHLSAVSLMYRRGGRALVIVIIIGHMLAVVPDAVRQRTRNTWHWPAKRAALLQQLARQGGERLLFVRYGPLHPDMGEWVYNGADIDAQTVVWAREMGPVEDRKLMQYYPSRSPWIVDLTAGDQYPVLRPYPTKG